MLDSFASNSKLDFIGEWYDAVIGRARWIETEASTVACIQSEDKEEIEEYLVTYSYQVNGKHYDGRYLSNVPVGSGTPLSIRYKPSNPKHNYLSDIPSGRGPLVLIVIAAGFGLFWLVLHLMSRGYY
jgi:hypothetical protein